ncbi:MAG: 30S ribosomal protein S16 [Saprospiraceae bacterium]|nr:30S ribosomal protein S16 [Saprospiraceae bacterium]MCF8249282.1 30S ribosomal protein S16 [Saprospiraceae bacterium]MCF8279703.1 30S ribosomal protein S16 [Bacteroidales bacterium]MCF8311441.1 30S ribosomal protein S16 [Saprospiraceae bacterium]MCF8439901.1 30S ribosomal protein S16 [Saprospiraceae bacterium]
MAVKIRLQRKGKKKKPFYHIVIADARSPRDGRFIEKIGTYNPLTQPATIELDRDKAFDWLDKGAQPTETVRAMLRFKGVFYRKHVMRGVEKGAYTEEVAMEKYNDYIAVKEAKTAARAVKIEDEKAAFRAKVAGLDIKVAHKKVIPKIEVAPAPVAVEEETPVAVAVEEVAAPAVVEAAPVAVAVEEAPAVEVVEEAPAAAAQEEE